jgi:hypothetical protein
MPARRSHDDRHDTELVGVEPEPEPDQAATMTAIALAESGGSTASSGEDARGLWQINVAAPARGVGTDPGAVLDGLDEAPAPSLARVDPAADALAFGAPAPDADDPSARGSGDLAPGGPDGPSAGPELDDEVLVGFAAVDAAPPEATDREADLFAEVPHAADADSSDDSDDLDPPAGWTIAEELAD